MTAFDKKLDSVFAQMKISKRPVVNYLQPGLSREYLLNATNELPDTFPDELVEMYLWKNGTHISSELITDQVCFFPGYYFLSIEDALYEYTQLISISNCPDIIEDIKWNKYWFPVFSNAAGDFYSVCLGDVYNKSNVLKCFSYDLPFGQEAFATLSALMKTVYDCYREDIFYLGEDNLLKMNRKEFNRIRMQNNSLYR